MNASTRAHTNGRTRRESVRMRACTSERERERESAMPCAKEGADLRREHTRTVERVTLGEGSRRKTKAKTKRKVGERSVSKTRDESKTEKRKSAKKERRLGQIGNRRGRLLHPTGKAACCNSEKRNGYSVGCKAEGCGVLFVCLVFRKRSSSTPLVAL